MTRVRVLAAALAVGMLTTSCFGPFNLTRRVYVWNDTVTHDKWAEEGIFLLISIIPVYGVAFIGDVLLFNSIEFWGGDNPIDPPTVQAAPRVIDADGNERLVTHEWHDGRPALGVEVVGADGRTEKLLIAQDAFGRAYVLDDDGHVVARAVRDDDGTLAAHWADDVDPSPER